MKSQLEQSTRIAIEMTINTLRLMSGTIWVTGNIPVDDCVLEDPDGLIRKIRDAAESSGFGWVQLDLLPSRKCISINGPKEMA
ncbi:hypothetical protein [Pseudomonas protegens]|uniref:hypothetical protein n=1 Tax=Pseudomonas protegens TaxID=380021 RepID=UPI00380CE9C2